MSGLLIYLVVFVLPLLGGLTAFVLRAKNGLLPTLSVSVAFLVSLGMILTGPGDLQLYLHWFPGFTIGVLIDKIAAILISLVLLISTLVHVFSMRYMEDDPHRPRYYAKLGFFTFSMIGLLMANHLVLLFVFWELVGVASYLLIGFWYSKAGVPASARLAFMVNRVADVALLVGMLILFGEGYSLFISENHQTWPMLASILIAIGAFGKSAQLPFSGWLQKAMVGPTPVSALIHAATMVVAGVYLLARVSGFLPFSAQAVIAVAGVLTALYGGISAVTQFDIKKVLAYSTISQLGYMIAGIGVGGTESSLFHLWTHAFFKAGLFLGAGSIIHYLHHTGKGTSLGANAQDMRMMGGLRSKLPWTFYTFVICGLALSGIPLFSGFMSKEGIVVAAWAWASQSGQTWTYMVPDIAFLVAFLTAIYIGRMILLVFFGEMRGSGFINKTTFKEGIKIQLPLSLLAIGSLGIIYHFNPFAHKTWIHGFIGPPNFSGDAFITGWATVISIVLGTGGWVLAYLVYHPRTRYAQYFFRKEGYTQWMAKWSFNGGYLTDGYLMLGRWAHGFAIGIYTFDKKAMDGLVHLLGISGVVIGKITALMDKYFIDGMVNALARMSVQLGRITAGLHARTMQAQVFVLVLGLVLILFWILF